MQGIIWRGISNIQLNRKHFNTRDKNITMETKIKTKQIITKKKDR